MVEGVVDSPDTIIEDSHNDFGNSFGAVMGCAMLSARLLSNDCAAMLTNCALPLRRHAEVQRDVQAEQRPISDAVFGAMTPTQTATVASPPLYLAVVVRFSGWRRAGSGMHGQQGFRGAGPALKNVAIFDCDTLRSLGVLVLQPMQISRRCVFAAGLATIT
jgi:hypothetical protein